MLSKIGKMLGIHTHKDWLEVDKTVYHNAYQQFGGSFITHPLMVESMSSVTSISIKYFAYYQNNELLGALPIWGDYIAGDKRYLKKVNKRRIFDAGNAEVILPLSNEKIFPISFKGQFISEIHKKNIPSLKRQSETLSLARSFHNGDFSKKFRYNRRRELKLFESDGGEIVAFDALTAKEIAAIYINLFKKRWGKIPKGDETLAVFLEKIRPLVTGYYLRINNKPIAIQLIYRACTTKGISAEYINGGVDPQYKQYSPGSILSFLNIKSAEEMAAKEKLPLRFSFGLTDKEYKNTWCKPHPIYRS